ncbi:transposase [Streptomyces canus]|nr:transposase [Streptomyces canus]
MSPPDPRPRPGRAWRRSAGGFAYAPQLADLPDQKMWRIDRTADYGAFTDAARGRVDLARIERRWEDILRIIGSVHTGAVRAYDVIRMLSRDGRPTPLFDVRDEDVARRSPFVRQHINMLGRYSFQLPELPGGDVCTGHRLEGCREP